MSVIRKILCLLSVALIFTASSAVPAFAEGAVAFTFTLQEDEISDDAPDNANAPAKVPQTGDTGCFNYLITAICAGGVAVCLIKFRSQENDRL